MKYFPTIPNLVTTVDVYKRQDMEPNAAKNHMLYMIEEIGECISIIKKKGINAIMQDSNAVSYTHLNGWYSSWNYLASDLRYPYSTRSGLFGFYAGHGNDYIASGEMCIRDSYIYSQLQICIFLF